MIPPAGMKDSLKKYVFTTPKTAFTGRTIYKKTRRKWFPILGERLLYIKNGFTLIWIMVSTSTKFALNKRTLEKKILFHSSELIAVNRISVSTKPKKLLSLLGTEKIEENWFTPNFNNAFQQQKKKLWIKAHSLKLTQNLYTLIVMKDMMKTPFLLAGKSCLHLQEYLQNPRKWFQRAGIMFFFKNWLTFNFMNGVH